MKSAVLQEWVLAAGLAAGAGISGWALKFYVLTDLGRIPSATAEIRINNRGVVLVHHDGAWPAVVFAGGETFDIKEEVDLPALPGGNKLFEAFDLNDEGIILGRAYYPDREEWRAVALLRGDPARPFGTVPVDLGSLEPGITARRAALSLNNEGTALVWCCASSPHGYRGFTTRWPWGAMLELPQDFFPERIGPGGAVVGRLWLDPPGGATFHAALHNALTRSTLDLGTLPDATAPPGSTALGIQTTAAGDHVVGWSTSATRFGHAFRWSASTGMVDLDVQPHPEKEGSTQARSVNRHGEIVGIIDPLFPHAAIFKDGLVVDLNFPARGGIVVLGAGGWTLRTADTVNDHGEIAGWGNKGVNDVRAFVLTPVRAFAERANGQVRVSWSAFLQGVELQRTDNLGRGDPWQKVTETSSMEGGRNVVRLAASAGTGYFRLMIE